VALHTETSIFKDAYDLLSVTAGLVRNMPKDAKPIIGKRLYDDCLDITTLIARANMAQDKAPVITELLERVQCTEVQFRMCRDRRFIATNGYAQAVQRTQAIGRQASGWKKYAMSPASGPSRRPGQSDR
jgi:hypothetical protein